MKQLTIRMKSDDLAEVLLYDQIGRSFWDDGIDAKTFREQIKGIKAKAMNLRINSPGGSVTEAAAMLSTLDDWKGRIEVDVDGLAASAASVVMLGGDTIRVASNALVMVHDPHGMIMGGAEEMRQMADLLDKVKGQILDRYARKTGEKTTREKLADLMAAETWFTGQEAVDAGLADQVTGEVRVAACANLDRFGYRCLPVLAPPGPTADDLERHRMRAEFARRL